MKKENRDNNWEILLKPLYAMRNGRESDEDQEES